MTIGHWLLVNVAMRIESGAMFSLGSGVVAVLIITPFRNAVKSGFRKLQRAIDSIDPDTPTGVTQQLEDLKRGQ